MQLDDWLDDLCVRFIINLPREELESVERICFQIEEAQWFYEDFIRPLNPSLPSLPLRTFSLRMFQHCPLFMSWSEQHYHAAFEEFIAYKTRVPVRGAILLNEDMTEVLLVKGWKKGANWSFPRGKINKDEKDLDCAIREAYEETGYDVQAAGLVQDEKNMKFIDITMREQQMRLYIFRGVPQETHFEPRTRKEISKIEWYKLSDLPTLKRTKHQEGTGESLAVNANKFYMVAPFMVPLKKWISQERKRDAVRPPADAQLPPVVDDLLTDGDPVSMNGHSERIRVEMPVQTPSDLPEVSISKPGPQEPSSHIKRLLNLESSSAPEAVPGSRNPIVDAEKSNALLALLRGASKPTATEQQPYTPIDQVDFPTKVPHTPHYHHSRQLQFSRIAPPPNFSISTDKSQRTDDLQPERSHSYSISANLPQAVDPTTFPSSTDSPARNSTIAAPRLDLQPATTGPFQSRGPAPYQRTGDPDFVRPDHAGAHASAIPPASNLPKLTNHTRALLDVFKSGPAVPQNLAEVSASPTHPPSSIGTFPMAPSGASITQAQPGSFFQQLSAVTHKSSDDFAGFAEKTISVELAAQATPSPKALEPAAQDILSLLAQKTATSKSDISPKRKQDATRMPPTLATVNGPLDMPQIHSMQKLHHRKNRSANGPSRTAKHKPPNVPQHGSIKILPRPTTAASTPLSSPKHPQESTSDVSPLSPPRKLETAPEQQKPFQPQILRRPQSRQRQRQSPSPSPLSLPADAPDNLVPSISPPQSAEEKPISAMISPMPPASAHVPQTSITSHVSDRRPSQQTNSHQQNLLSLFSGSKESRDNSNASTLRAPPSRDSTILVSPLQEPIRNTPNPPQLALRTSSISPPGRSRIGSLGSVVGQGNIRGITGTRDEVSREATPTSARTTKADDKAFLMGYLERVARGEGARVR
ncbi:MAG: hypothetical protein Q9160_008066 [Pyrenula sp. 1 TL-2023]